MRRRFKTHDIRDVTELDGVWDFVFLGDVDPDEVDVTTLAFPDRMAVPGCFDATPAYAGKRGLAAYRVRVWVRDYTPHRLWLNGVHHWSRVYVDGELLNEHVGGFTRFATDVRDHEPGAAEIVVLVDNRFDYERNPLHHEYFDWYHFGGIARGATWERLGELWIEDVQVTTTGISPAEVEVRVRYQAVEPTGPTALALFWDDELVLNDEVTLDETTGILENRLELPGTALWSPESPDLHMLYVRLGDDDRRERVGVRQVTVADRQIMVNGEPLRLLGFNRHAAHPQFGHAVPEMIQVSDVQQLRDMGCNFVRGSHYPQDDMFLDLCDEAGLCVWSEVIGWQHPEEHLADPHFVTAQEEQAGEMVTAAYNHPSVIMWGILNESHSHDPACRPGYEAILERLRELDGSRPLTFASNHPFEDVCLDLIDVISVNTYPGWYHGGVDNIPAALDAIVEHLDAHGQEEKPLIISEIGAGAVPGWRDWNAARWSEQYQARLLDTVIRTMFMERDRYSGLAIWQFCDVRTSEAVRKILGRPRGFNNKGVVDEYRRPKLAYDVVKGLFHALSE